MNGTIRGCGPWWCRWCLPTLCDCFAGWSENQGFPYATLIANVVGCVAIGILLFLIDQREFLNAHWRVFVVTGILGSLTTFSTFSYESYSLWMSGERSLAVAAVSANVVVGIAAVACGWTAASRLS